MPVIFVGATNAFNNGATALTVNVPAGVQNGDVLLLLVGEYAGVSSAFATPSGWTLQQSTTSSAWTALYSRTASAEPASYSLGSNGNQVAAVMLAYRNVSFYSAAIQANASSTSIVAPSLTPGVGDPADILVSLFNTGSNESSITPPGSQTLRQNSPITSSPCVFASDETLTSASATGTRTATMSPYASANVGVSVLLRPTNTAPNAPTSLAPAGSTVVDRSVVQRLSWTFSDPNAGDSQSKFDLQWRHAGTSDAWNTVSQTTPNNYYDVPASTFPAEDIEWQVRTYDQAGAVGPYSALAYFTAANPATPPTITAPTSGGTVSQNPTNVTWSTAGQQGYQVRRVRDNAGVADTTTVYYDTGQITDTTTRTASVPFETNNRWEWVQVRVEQGGLWSAWSSIRVDVSYTQPATATLVAAGNNTTGAITVTITNPTPSGGQPAVAYNDVYVRAVGDTSTGTRIATGVANNGTATYWTPASGVAYEFLARTFGSNSTSTDSAWTA